MKNYITYSTSRKTYCITSRDTAHAMITYGNPYGHNRCAPIRDRAALFADLAKKGFKPAEKTDLATF